jgi:hypothetical protein
MNQAYFTKFQSPHPIVLSPTPQQPPQTTDDTSPPPCLGCLLTSTFTCLAVPSYCVHIVINAKAPLTIGHQVFLSVFSLGWIGVGGTNLFNNREAISLLFSADEKKK